MPKVLILNFDGLDGSKVFLEEAQGLVPSYTEGNEVTDTSWCQFGSGSLRLDSNSNITWTLPTPNSGDFTAHSFIYCDPHNPSTTEIQSFLSLAGDDNGKSLSVAAKTIMGVPTIQVYGDDGVTGETEYFAAPDAGVSFHIALVYKGSALMFFLNGAKKLTWTTMDFTEVVYTVSMSGGYTAGGYVPFWTDAVEVTYEAKWDDDFVPPTSAPSGGNSELPLLAIQGELDSHQDAWLPCLQVLGQIENSERTIEAAFLIFPLLTISGAIIAGPHATLEQKTPALRGGLPLENPVGSVYGYEAGRGGAILDRKIPKIALSAGATKEGTANLSKAIARIKLAASAYADTGGALSATIPAVRGSATGTIGQIASLARPIPMVRLTASAIAGMIGSLEKSIPTIKIDANSYWLSGASLQKAIPAIRISARVEGILTEIIALALNTKNFGLSKYTSYPYNSMCVFNGKVLGAKSGGLYELSGATDDGTNIEWKLRTPLINLEKNKLRNVWLHGKLSGDIKMIVETADGDRYEYDAEPVNEHEDAVRVKVGRGLDARYIIIEFQNESDQVVTVDKIEGFGVKL